MTREEAIKELSYIADEMPSMECRDWKEAIQMAIKALEQEPILDKIRAEINDIAFDWQEIDCEHESYMVVDLDDVLNIIDKYKEGGEKK